MEIALPTSIDSSVNQPKSAIKTGILVSVLFESGIFKSFEDYKNKIYFKYILILMIICVFYLFQEIFNSGNRPVCFFFLLNCALLNCTNL